MRIDKVTAVSDMPGLYVIVGQKKDGVIIESLDNQSLIFLHSKVTYKKFNFLETEL